MNKQDSDGDKEDEHKDANNDEVSLERSISIEHDDGDKDNALFALTAPNNSKLGKKRHSKKSE